MPASPELKATGIDVGAALISEWLAVPFAGRLVAQEAQSVAAEMKEGQSHILRGDRRADPALTAPITPRDLDGDIDALAALIENWDGG